MDWLNYHHLLYFWTVAQEGGLGPASRTLRLARPTLSTQIRQLEQRLGEPLFRRQGRQLVLTEAGHVVFRYAEEIFSLGRELLAAMSSGVADRVTVGVAEAVPKVIVRRLLSPLWSMPEAVRVVCIEDSSERLLARLAAHELDVLVSDQPLPANSPVRAYNHLLGECGVTFFAAPSHVRVRSRFPQSLHGAPLLLPTAGASLRRELDQWFEESGIRPRVVAEFEDSALLKACGQEGVGVFPGPSAVEKEICAQYRVRVVGRVPEVRERFFLLSAERRLKHPAVVALSEAGRRSLFG